LGGGTSVIIKYLKNEMSKHDSAGVDVLFGGGDDPFIELKSAGFLEKYDLPAEIQASIPTDLNGHLLYDPDHYWYGAALSTFGIVCNERVRATVGLPPVNNWADLADPRLATWVVTSDPRASGSALAVYENILQDKGWEAGWRLLAEIGGNSRAFYTSGASGAVETGFGDAAYGLSIDVYGHAQSGYYGKDNVSFLVPAGETAITPDGIAILKNPPHPAIAQHFLDFVMGHEGQLLWMQKRGQPGGATRFNINRMSVSPAIYAELGSSSNVENPFTMVGGLKLNSKISSQRKDVLPYLMGAWLIDTHTEAAIAWRELNSVNDLKKQAALQDEFTNPPLSEADLVTLGAGQWHDANYKITQIVSWEGQAIERYRRIADEARQFKSNP
jgi:ABC-type Fe3+ transport system substrate-binding protein